jgi:putative DNA methylase
MTDRTRLIEVAFPLKQASIASVHEKSVRHGHISTLHIWPARRPLAACRAALLATLLPDPGKPETRQELLDKIGGAIVTRPVKVIDNQGNTTLEDKQVTKAGVLGWGQEGSFAMDEFRQQIREFFNGSAPRVLDAFAGGGAIPLEAMRLGCDVTAADLNPVAWFLLKCTLAYPKAFSGKKWPMPSFVCEWPDFVEDYRSGKVKKRRSQEKAHFSDPRQLGLIDLPDADLSWQIRTWGKWVLEQSRVDLASRYPVIGGQPTIAYLWARTARDKITSGKIPLLKTFWLSKKRGRRAAILPMPKPDNSGVDFRVLQETDLSNPQKIITEYPFLTAWEVKAETLYQFLSQGTKNQAGVWSPISGRPGLIALTMEDLRRQGHQGLLGTQMTAVVVEATKPGKRTTFKRYRSPSPNEIQAADVQTEELTHIFSDIPFGRPIEQIPVGTSRRGGGSAFTAPIFGLDRWEKLFTSRQLFAVGTFVKHTRLAASVMKKLDYPPEWIEAIVAYLSLVCDKLTDYIAALCTWHVNRETMSHVFVRYALPMTWDIAEINPLSNSSGNYSGCLDWVARVAQHTEAASRFAPAAEVLAQSAVCSSTREFDCILTDPPYYDAIPYSDLMDFFYVWLRRTIHGVSSEIDRVFRAESGPKWNHEIMDGELIDDSGRFGGDTDKSKQAYEDGMFRAFQAFNQALKSDGRLVVVFANKQSEAWEALVSAMIRAGFVVDASWPIQTELPNRTRGASSAALSSSVWIVCRKRSRNALPGWEENILAGMKESLFAPREVLAGRNILQYFFDLGIQGPDFMWAALGPALEAFSAHPFVKKTAGGVMKVDEFLSHVRRLVLHFSLGELPGFREVQQETKGRGESLEIDPITQYFLLHRAFFGLDPAPAGACILYANACGKNETELKIVWNILEQGGRRKKGRPRSEEEDPDEVLEDSTDSKGNEYRLLGWHERSRDQELGETKGGHPAPLIDKLHRLMYLFEQNRTLDVQRLFESWGLANERAFKPLLQAVRELAIRDHQETERRLVEALATQLRVNKKTVVIANEMKEVSLFDSVEQAPSMRLN